MVFRLEQMGYAMVGGFLSFVLMFLGWGVGVGFVREVLFVI